MSSQIGDLGVLNEALERIERLESALREVVRHRLATGEGTCAQRFDRAWQCATDALASTNSGGVDGA